MNKQDKMYRSNAKSKEWLTKNKFTDIWLHYHTRYQKDEYGLWDGHCFDQHGNITFFQIKSNAFPSSKKIKEWMKGKNVKALAINVRDNKPLLVRVFCQGIINEIPQIVVSQIEDR